MADSPESWGAIPAEKHPTTWGAIPANDMLGAAGAAISRAIADSPAAAAGITAAEAAGALPIPHPLLKVAAMVGAGAGASIATSLGMHAITPTPIQKMLAEQGEKYPLATTVGGVLSAAPFFVPGRMAEPVATALMHRAAMAGIGGGLATASELANAPEGHMFGENSGAKIAIEAAGNALLNKPTKLGQGIIDMVGSSAKKLNLIPQIEAGMKATNPRQANEAANQVGMDTAAMPEPTGILRQDQPNGDVKFGQDEAPPPDLLETLNDKIEKKREENLQKVVDGVANEKDIRVITKSAEDSANFFKEYGGLKDAHEEAVNYAGAKPQGTLGENIGKEVEYAGYKGKLVKDAEGNYGVLQPVAKKGTNFVEIEGHGKDPNTLLTDVDVKPLATEVKPVTMAPVMPEVSGPAPKKATWFSTSRGSTYEVDSNGNTIRTKRSPGKGQGQTDEATPAVFIRGDDVDKVQAAGTAGNRIILEENGKQIRPEKGDDIRGKDIKIVAVDSNGNRVLEIPVSTSPIAGFHPFEIAYKGGEKRWHLGNEITEVSAEKPTPKVEYLGKKHLVMEGVGAPVDQWQVKFPGEARGRTLTADQMKAEGIPIPPINGAKPSQGIRFSSPIGVSIGEPLLGSVIGYQFGDTDEEKRHNALMGAAIGGSASMLAGGIAGKLTQRMQAKGSLAISEPGPFRAKRSPLSFQPEELVYKINPDKTADVQFASWNGVQKEPTIAQVMQGDNGKIPNSRKYKSLDYDELLQVAGPKIADMVFSGKGTKLAGDYTHIADLKSPDFGKKYGPSGIIAGFNPAAINLSAPVMGGIIGYQFGDTDEEKRKNAWLGVALGAGGALANTIASRMAAKNPENFNKVKAAVDAAKEARNPTEGETLVHNVETPPIARQSEQDAPSVQLANPNPRYQWVPWMSKTGFGKFLKVALGTVEDNVMAISKRMGGALREYQGLIDNLRVKWTEGTEPLHQLVRKNMKDEDIRQLNYLIWQGKMDEATSFLAQQPNGEMMVGEFNKARQTYESMAQAQEAVGREVNRLEGAWPRQMLDYEKFRESLDMEEQGAMDQVFAKAEKEKGRALNQQEKADLLNSAISLNLQGKPSFLKPRSVQGLSSQQVWDLYEPFDVAMSTRIQRVSGDVARRKFVGHDSPESIDLWDGRTGDFGQILADEKAKGNIPREGERVILDNLKDLLRLNQGAESAIVKAGNWVSRAQNTAFISDITSMVGQFGDVFPSIMLWGPGNTLKGYGQRFLPALFGEGVKLDQLGLSGEKFAEAMAYSNSEANKGFMGWQRRARNWTLQKMIGVWDGVNKEASVNAARSKFINALKDTGSSDYIRYDKQYSEMFPERWPEILRDLKSPEFAQGKLNDNTRFFLFNELSRIQPLGLAQRAQLESQTPALRFMYSLKRYWVKQMNILRTEGYEKMKDPATRVEGLMNTLLYVSLVSMGQGLAVNTIKDMIFNRDDQTPLENAVSGVVQTMGISSSIIKTLKEEGPGMALASWMLPINQVALDAEKDYSSGALGDLLTSGDTSNLKSIKYTPIIGRLAYRYEGGGEAAQRKSDAMARRQSRGSSGSPTLDELEKLLVPRDSRKK